MFNKEKNMIKLKAFTLIELLIVVAIIAILAAIAVPNFLEAQVRAKVSRVQADLRTLRVAMEAYAVDNNKYLPSWHGAYPQPQFPETLSSPISYFSGKSTVLDPFQTQDMASDPYWRLYNYFYWKGYFETYATTPLDVYRSSPMINSYLMASVGPDRVRDYIEYSGPYGKDAAGVPVRRYDPTNGTISAGDIVVYGP
jgi:prepilin-type N-terminal cleavage/methylation domain-containing protein